MSRPAWGRFLAPPPGPPELPEAARPRLRVWHGPVALVGGIAVLVVVTFPLFPVLLLSEGGETAQALSLLVLVTAQDALFVGAAVLFAFREGRPRPWHFGARASPLWRTIGWTALGFALLLGFELGYIALLDVDETNVDELGSTGVLAAVGVALATIVVAPVTEEIFFRAFFYRALRARLRVWSAALINGVVFGALHFEGINTVEILPVIAFVGVGLCLVYERTGSLFAVIAIHAAFNTFATLAINWVVALVIGLLVLAACLFLPRRLGPAPSPFAGDPRARLLHA